MSEEQLIIFFLIVAPVTFVAPLAYYFGIWIAPLLLYLYEGLIIAIKIKLAFNELMKQLSIQQANSICLVFCIPPIVLFSIFTLQTTDIMPSNIDLLIHIGIDSRFKEIISLCMYSLFLATNMFFLFQLRRIAYHGSNTYARIRATDTQSFRQMQLNLQKQLLWSKLESLKEIILKKNRHAKIAEENRSIPVSIRNSNETLIGAFPLNEQNQQLIDISNQLKEIVDLKSELTQIQELSRLQLVLNEFEIHLKNKHHSGHVLMSRSANKENDQGLQCAICLEDFLGESREIDKRIYTLDCQHSYHSFCILKSIQAVSRNCPYCRKVIMQKLSIE